MSTLHEDPGGCSSCPAGRCLFRIRAMKSAAGVSQDGRASTITREFLTPALHYQTLSNRILYKSPRIRQQILSKVSTKTLSTKHSLQKSHQETTHRKNLSSHTLVLCPPHWTYNIFGSYGAPIVKVSYVKSRPQEGWI